MTGAPYAPVAQAYDAFADEYDEWVGEHVSARRAKAALLRRVRALTRADDRVLDVGCGTGSEAVVLARAGRRVVGVDVAPRMVALAREKARRAQLGEERARFVVGAAGRPDASWTADGPFAAAYAAYGVLNLEPRPLDALAALARLVRPGGHLLVGTLNPTALFELTIYPFALRLKGFRKALRPEVLLRLGHGRDERAWCRLPSNAAFARAGRAAGLALVEEVGLHVLMPPPSEGLVRRLPRLVAAVNHAEQRFETRAPFCRFGYFSLLVFRRDSP